MPGPSRSCRPRGATAALGMTFRATCTYESTKPYTRVWGTGGGPSKFNGSLVDVCTEV
jgi:hypothetical protein